MKKIKFLSVFMIVCLSLNAQTKNVEKQFYYGFDEKIEIHKVEKKGVY